MKEIKGDLLQLFEDGQFDLIAHGCNCQTLMSAGIARQIALKYPEAQVTDDVIDSCMQIHTKKSLDSLRLDKMGDYSIAYIQVYGKGRVKMKEIVNLYTQFYPGANFDSQACSKALKALNELEKERRGDWLNRLITKKRTIGLPLIGCGIGGGSWREVKQIIQKELTEFNVVIVHYGS